MNSLPETQRTASLSDYLAAERTFLAWIRTGLALMGFGFVVARFGIFLERLQVFENPKVPRSSGLSLWFGTLLIAVGVVVNLSSSWRYLRLLRELDRGERLHSRRSTQAVLIALFLALIGLAMAIYLVFVRSSAGDPNSPQHTEGPMGAATRTASASNGIITIRSNHSVDETVKKLETILQAKEITLFPLVDDSGEAEKVALKMRQTKLLIFDSPKAGTSLMLADPTDFPLKILVWEDP